MDKITRRHFCKRSLNTAIAFTLPGVLNGCLKEQDNSGLPDSNPRELPPGDGIKATVSSVKGENLDAMTRDAIEAIGGMNSVVNSGETIFIKPNLVTFPWAETNNCFHIGECTKPEIIIAAAEECLKAGAEKVIIGDGSHLPTFSWQYAITLDGKLVNIDGMGNRVAPMIFGPRKVIVVVGANKIANSVEEALERVHQVAAPLNAIRHYLKHNMTRLGDLPCVRTGRYVDCSHNARICRYTVVIEGNDMVHKGRINVVLIGEELGL